MKVLSNVFEGMMLNINCPPLELHNLFSQFKHIDIVIDKGVYYINYLSQEIAKIQADGEYRLMLLPGGYLNRRIEVFKTYNLLLNTFTDGYFLKYIADKWTLCKKEI